MCNFDYKFFITVALAMGVFASVGTVSAEEIQSQYVADVLPENASPAWARVLGEGVADIKDGKLVVEVEGNKRQFYALGTNNLGVPWGDAQKWSMGAQATIDIRLKCASDMADDPTFTVIVRDGSQQWDVRFAAASTMAGVIDASEWDTYRITIADSKLQVSSYHRKVILRGLRSTNEQKGNALLFGSYSYRPESLGTRGWEIAFLRWTTDDADFTPPDQEN